MDELAFAPMTSFAGEFRPQKRVEKRRCTTSLEHLNHSVAKASTAAVTATASLVGRTLSNASQSCRRIASERKPVASVNVASSRWNVVASNVSTMCSALPQMVSDYEAKAERYMRRCAQRMLDLSYTFERPPHRFTQNQVDQAALSRVYGSSLLFVLSCVLAVTFVMWAFLSAPVPEIDYAHEHKKANACAFYVVIVVLLLSAFTGGIVLSCALDAEHPLPRALLLLV